MLKKRKTQIVTMVVFIVCIFLSNSYKVSAAVDEEDFSRTITISLNGGTGSRVDWITYVDRTGVGYTVGHSFPGLAVGKTVLDKYYVAHTIIGYSDSQTPIIGTFKQHTDCIGVTPYVYITEPTRIGYTFNGWSSNTTAIKDSSYWRFECGCYAASSGNITITAQWAANTYNIAYNGNGYSGGSTANSSHTYGTAKTLTANGYTRTGYTFKGWNTKADGSGTSYSNSQSVSNLTTTSGATITLYAQWTVNTYIVAYSGNGNTGGSTASSSHTYGVAKTLTANEFTRTGYTFTGWNTKADGSGTSYSNSQSVSNLTSTNGATVTLYAQWSVNTYTVAYNGNGSTGGSTASSSHTYGTAKVLTTNGFTRTGYTFKGWNTKADGSGTSYSNSQSVSNLTTANGGTITLYAQWTVNAYTVAYNGNGSTGGSTASSSHTYGTAKTLTANGYTRIGYTFKGWNTKADGSGTSYSNSQSVSNLTATNGETITLYAQWTVNTYTIVYNGNGNTGGSTANSSHTYGTAKTLTANGYTRTGYTFKGWNTKADGSGTSYSNSQSVSNLTATNGATITLYAKWSDETAPTITADVNPASWTNQNAIVTASGTDNGSGIKCVTINIGNEMVSYGTVTAQYPQTSEGIVTYTAIVEDNAGNKSSKNVTAYVDKSAPKLTTSISSSGWSNVDVTISASATDSLSGVKVIEIYDGSDRLKATASGDLSYTIKDETNEVYTIKAYDNVGNVSERKYVVKIDKTPPEIKGESLIEDGKINHQAIDEMSGIRKFELYDSLGNNVEESDGFLYKNNNIIYYDTRKTYLEFWTLVATDFAGNVTELQIHTPYNFTVKVVADNLMTETDNFIPGQKAVLHIETTGYVDTVEVRFDKDIELMASKEGYSLAYNIQSGREYVRTPLIADSIEHSFLIPENMYAKTSVAVVTAWRGEYSKTVRVDVPIITKEDLAKELAPRFRRVIVSSTWSYNGKTVKKR